MKKIIPLLVIFLVGTMSHFAYDFFGKNAIVGLFTPINESVWEHYKLIIFPLIAVALFMVKDREILSLGLPLAAALIHSMLMMIGLYYIYSTAFGIEETFILDIANFILTSTVGYILLMKLSQKPYGKIGGIIGWIISAALVFAVFYLTYYPLNTPLFIDFSKKISEKL